MGKPDFHKIYDNPLDALACEGYYDGRRSASCVPGPNRHPAYVHGFMNARDDLSHLPRKSSQEISSDWNYIESVFGGTDAT